MYHKLSVSSYQLSEPLVSTSFQHKGTPLFLLFFLSPPIPFSSFFLFATFYISVALVTKTGWKGNSSDRRHCANHISAITRISLSLESCSPPVQPGRIGKVRLQKWKNNNNLTVQSQHCFTLYECIQF